MGDGRTSELLRDGFTKRHLWAWSMYDFANSGYTTVVITAVFNAYFVSIVAENAVWATFLWTSVLAVSYLFVIITGPLIGTYIDLSGARKKVLVIATFGCAFSTFALSSVGKGDLWFASVFLVLSNYFFGIGENVIASYLPNIAKEKSVGRVSGIGWAVGYLGGIFTLILVLLSISYLQSIGWEAGRYVPFTMLITGFIFILAALPTFIYLDNWTAAKPTVVRLSFVFDRFLNTLRQHLRFQDLFRFLLSTIFFQAGVQAVIALAAIYAQQVIGFTFVETIILIMVVNVTAACGAYLFGYLHDAAEPRQSLIIILIGWIIVTLLAWSSDGRPSFWVVANLAGLLLGACQANARAFVSVLTPKNRQAEFFGLWGLSVKCASIIGPLTYGVLSWATGGDHKKAILSLVALFVIGLIILITVDTKRGISAADQPY